MPLSHADMAKLTFLSGIIFTFCTCPVVSKICFKTSSVTLGSSPPTYNALLFGSGAARLMLPPALIGDMMVLRSIGPLTSLGTMLLLWGMLRGGGICGCEPFSKPPMPDIVMVVEVELSIVLHKKVDNCRRKRIRKRSRVVTGESEAEAGTGLGKRESMGTGEMNAHRDELS